MEILRSIKNNRPISSNFATILIILREMQILLMFMLDQNITLYRNIFQISILKYQTVIQILVILNFSMNLILLFYGILKIVLFKKSTNLKLSNSLGFLFLQTKPHLLLPCLLNLNFKSIKQLSTIYMLTSIFNIVFLIFQIYVIKMATISYRLHETNHLRKKSYFLIPQILQFGIIFMQVFVGNLASIFLLLLRSIFLLYFHSKSLQSQQTRRLESFFSLLTIIVIFIYIGQAFLNILIFSNTVYFTFIFVFSCYSCQNLVNVVSLKILKINLENSEQFLKTNQQNQINDCQVSSLKQDEIQKILISIRILVKIYFSKTKSFSLSQQQKYSSDDFNNWWNYYNRSILDHKISCNNVTCICRMTKQRVLESNQKIQQKIFAERIFKLLTKLISSSTTKDNKLKIVQNYFLIEIQHKPMQTYYQLVRLFRNLTLTQQIIQIQNFMFETRDHFHKLFIKQKVQNQHLQIAPLLQFKQKMQSMNNKIGSLALQYKTFYDLFVNNFVQMQALKQNSLKLSNIKRQFTQQIDILLSRFPKNPQLLTFSLMYFRIFDQYTQKIQIIQKKVQMIGQNVYSQNINLKRGQLDIFHPSYGAIQADLAFKPGTIISYTSNFIRSLGFSAKQIQGQKINKFMPHMFSRIHDRILRNFYQKGSMKMLKYKQKVYYARNASKFLVPVVARLKVDFLKSQSLTVTALMNPAPTKSQFVILNNYGKIEQMTQKIYRLLFQPCFNQNIVKIKRISIFKMVLSLNHLLKNVSQTSDQIFQGVLAVSPNQNVLNSYYKHPQFSINQLKKSNDTSATINSYNQKTLRTHQSTTTATQTSKSFDFSQDQEKFTVDLKESFRKYIKQLKFQKINGFRISYKFYQLITSQFKCKIFQIVKIKAQLTQTQLKQQLSRQILQLNQLYNFQPQQIQRFKHISQQQPQQQSQLLIQSPLKQSTHRSKHQQQILKTLIFDQLDNQQLSLDNSHVYQNKQQKNHMNYQGDGDGGSQGSTLMLSANEEVKKNKENVTAAFYKGIVISEKLQISLLVLIFCMILSLAVICVFSIALKGNYQTIQEDNLIISNFRINFMYRLAIQQLFHFYTPFNVTRPAFLTTKTKVLTDSMKQQLLKSTKKISSSISSQFYFKNMTIVSAQNGFEQKRAMLTVLQMIYQIFLLDQELGEHITDNYININQNLVDLQNMQLREINEYSQFSLIKIHIVVAIYSILLVAIFIVIIYLNRLSIRQQNKVIDYLAFINILLAKKKVKFFQNFIEYIKSSQQIQYTQIYQANLDNQSKLFEKDIHTQSQLSKNNKSSHNRKLSTQQIDPANTNSHLIRVIRNEKYQMKFKTILAILVVLFLCGFVIFISEYFFTQTHNKFTAYLELKTASTIVENVPPRIILLYLTNTDKVLNNQPPLTYPQAFPYIAHDQSFNLNIALSHSDVFGTQMQKQVSHNFNQNICNLIQCSNPSKIVENQQVYYLTYRYLNAFDYMRKIAQFLPTDPDPIKTLQYWLQQSNIKQIFKSTEYILDLMRENQQQISNLFARQIETIGITLLSLSLTLIPLLVVSMIYVRNKIIQYSKTRLQTTQQIYKHVSWDILSLNAYAVNYFQQKLKNSKKL